MELTSELVPMKEFSKFLDRRVVTEIMETMSNPYRINWLVENLSMCLMNNGFPN